MNLIDYLDKGAARFPDHLAVRDGQEDWTYLDLKALTHRIADTLIAAGLQAGDPVATYTPNAARAFACQYGIARAGLNWVPVNARNSVHEIAATLRLVGTRLLFFHSTFQAEVAHLRAEVSSLEAFVCIDSESVDASSLERWLTPHNDDLTYFARGGGDVVSLPCTSGTTGLPKAVMLTNNVWEGMIANFQILLRHDGVLPVNLVAAPMTHAAGYAACTILSQGGTNVFLAAPDPLRIMEAIESYRVTMLFVPPTLIYMMLSHPRAREFDYSSLRYFMYGGAPMSVDKLKEATNTFGCVMMQIYGQTEAPLTATVLMPEEHRQALSDPALEHRLLSAGREGPLVQVEIMDDEGRLLPPHAKGEVVIRGSIVMSGYYENAAANAEVAAGDWHRTGDIGTKDQHGFLFVLDRKKDMIISGGFNVYPAEVEQVIWTHPSVQDCAVIGAPDDKWGEAVTAVVQLKQGCEVDEADLIALCKQRLGSVKAPKRIEFWDDLPRSGVGKVLKREIRTKFWQGQERGI